MRDDVLDRLRRENPVPETMPPLPIERVLRRLGDQPVMAPMRSRPRRHVERFALGLSVLVVLTVAGAAVVLLGGGHRPEASPSHTESPLGPPALQSVSTPRQLLGSFAVFRRPQTRADRPATSLPLVGPGGGGWLRGLTRRVATLRSRDLYLIVEHARPNRHLGAYSLGFWFGNQIGGESGNANYFPVPLTFTFPARATGVWFSVAPDGVARVQWTMSSRASCRAPARCAAQRFRVDLPVRDNVAVVRPPVVIGCKPAECMALHASHVIWYDARGKVIAEFPGGFHQTKPAPDHTQ